MSDPFTVDPEQLADTLERMIEFQRLSEAIRAEIETQVTNLHITWAGEAAAAHGESHAQWKRGAEMMRKALEELRAAGTGAHHNYTGVIAANTAMWS